MLESLLFVLPSFVLATVITLLLFNIQKFFHELGHLVVAKRVGVIVDEFGVGYRPRIFKIYQSQNTVYTLNWLLFGSFVKMAGEKDSNVSNGFASKSKKARFAVLIIGPVISLLILGLCLLPSIIFFSLANMAGVPEVVSGVNLNGEKAPLAQSVITEVLEDTPATEAGLQVGDVIVGADGVEFNYVGDAVSYIGGNKGTEIVLSIERDGEEIEIPIVPRSNPPEDQGALGISLIYEGYTTEIIHYPLHIALVKGTTSTFQYIGLILYTPLAVSTGDIPAEAIRPVGVGEAYQNFEGINENLGVKWYPKFLFMGVLSIFPVFPLVLLTIISFLPIPGWDSWRILSLVRR